MAHADAICNLCVNEALEINCAKEHELVYIPPNYRLREDTMRDPVGTVRLGPTGDVSVQTSWSATGENVRIINPVTGTAGFQTEDYVADWLVIHDTT